MRAGVALTSPRGRQRRRHGQVDGPNAGRNLEGRSTAPNPAQTNKQGGFNNAKAAVTAISQTKMSAICGKAARTPNPPPLPPA